ncbi:hypothetical protein CEXT_154071 [Caerostris extrusa]|uniref:Uncharacterized protein n=1 Tax=Caerostris extrusa TaxID=172846 RepID=A0AAV4S8C6_CAEEX|nr:hypothetical protein CEXT_154071 [Caerostris extrusa]
MLKQMAAASRLSRIQFVNRPSATNTLKGQPSHLAPQPRWPGCPRAPSGPAANRVRGTFSIPKNSEKPVQQTKRKGQALSRAGQPGPKSSATTPVKRTITNDSNSDSGGSSNCPESNVEQKAESPANHSDQRTITTIRGNQMFLPHGPSAPHHPTLLQPKNNNCSSNRSLFPSCCLRPKCG